MKNLTLALQLKRRAYSRQVHRLQSLTWLQTAIGFSKAEIINGLCEALVRNYINNLGRGKQLNLLCLSGRVAANQYKSCIWKEIEWIIIPEHFGVMGAIGAAILAREYILQSGENTTFKGFEVADFDFTPSSFECNGCSNCCEVIKVEIDGEIIAALGDRCGKWTNMCSGKKRKSSVFQGAPQKHIQNS